MMELPSPLCHPAMSEVSIEMQPTHRDKHALSYLLAFPFCPVQLDLVHEFGAVVVIVW